MVEKKEMSVCLLVGFFCLVSTMMFARLVTTTHGTELLSNSESKPDGIAKCKTFLTSDCPFELIA